MENLLQATPRQTCMPAGTSALGHDAFKILRNANLMRLQQLEGEKQTQSQYQKLRNEMYNRKKAFDESVTDYKVGLVKARERKRAVQGENSQQWTIQMDWKNERQEQEHRDMQYDPHTMWNVEGPNRRREQTEKKLND
jgi:hypothetical protein